MECAGLLVCSECCRFSFSQSLIIAEFYLSEVSISLVFEGKGTSVRSARPEYN